MATGQKKEEAAVNHVNETIAAMSASASMTNAARTVLR
jgi:hypothetical protein